VFEVLWKTKWKNKKARMLWAFALRSVHHDQSTLEGSVVKKRGMPMQPNGDIPFALKSVG
jgi:hypothetical protein